MRDEDDAKLVAAAQAGDAEAVELLMAGIRDRIYRLSLRMVTQRADAEDATQEVLVKILTRLSTFRGDAQFATWAHRIAVNHLLDRKKSAVEQMELTFDMYGDDLRRGLSESTVDGPEGELLATEVRLGCTQAMLTCLDREHRVAYVLGEVFEVSSVDGAYICDVPSATYRKRLSRARDRVRSFLNDNCGLVNPDRAACRCSRRIETAVCLGRINPSKPEFVGHPAEDGAADMERLFDAAALMRSHPAYKTPTEVADRISALVHSDEFDLLR
jgi:RNA polymerase sigma factor (sigma-70 family)